MSLEATMLSQTTTESMLPVVPRNTASSSTDIFVKLKNYIVLYTGQSNPLTLLKKTANGYKTIKVLPKVGLTVPQVIGNNDAFVTKDGANCSITITFIDPNTDEVTRTSIVVSTATPGGSDYYHVDTCNGTIFVAAQEGASSFLYVGTVNFTNKTVSFIKKTIQSTAVTSGGNQLVAFMMLSDTIFHHYAYANSTPVYGIYTISAGIITKTNAAMNTGTANITITYAVIHTNSSAFCYNGDVSYLRQHKTTQATDGSTSYITPLTTNAPVANQGALFIDNITGVSFVNMYNVDGYCYTVQGDTCDALAPVGLPAQIVGDGTTTGACKLGGFTDDIAFILDPFNNSFYYGTAVTYSGGTLTKKPRRIKLYTNNTAKTQLITSVSIASYAHANNPKYTAHPEYTQANVIGVSINDKILFMDTFSWTTLRTFANCPIALKPNEYISLEVLNAFGDITTTINGIVDTTQA